MKAGKLAPGCRQYALFQELQRRPEGMTSLEAVRFLAEQGICSIDVRDDLATIRKGAAAYGWRLLPAEPVRKSEHGSKVFRYRLLRQEPGAAAGNDAGAAEAGATRPAEARHRPAPPLQGTLIFPPAWEGGLR